MRRLSIFWKGLLLLSVPLLLQLAMLALAVTLEVRSLLWLGALISIGMTLLLAYVFQRSIGGRLARLMDNVQRLGQGQDLPVPEGGDDEIARLDHAFREMAQQLSLSTATLLHALDEARALYNQAPCGYHSVDGDGTIIAINDTELLWLGYEREEVVSRKKFRDFLAPESVPTFEKHFPDFKKEGFISNLEFEMVRKDGSRLPVLVNATAVFGPRGEFVTSRSTLFDITQRKQAEERFRGLLEAAPDAIVIVSEQGHIQLVNLQAERLFGYARREMIGQSVEMLLPMRFWGRHEKHRAGYFRDPQPRLMGAGYELYGLRRDGSEFPVEVSLNPIPTEEGLLVSSAIRDISERKKTDEKIRLLNEELEDRVHERTAELEVANRDLAQKNQENELFVYSVSHDLRSPLVNLQGFSKELSLVCDELRGLLQNDEVPAAIRAQALALLEGDMAESTHFIQNGVMRLSNIIDALLRLSRVGRVVYQAQAVRLKPLLTQIIDSLQSTIAERNTEVRVAEHLPTLWGDPLALEQLFANLIGNALKYLDPKRPGRIEIGVADQNHRPAGDKSCVLFVKDNGLGIPKEYQHKMFQAFQRCHPGVASGEGMGLAIVQRIVDRHRGQIWVDSTSGQGSVFYISLPGKSVKSGVDDPG